MITNLEYDKPNTGRPISLFYVKKKSDIFYIHIINRFYNRDAWKTQVVLIEATTAG